MDKPKQSQVRIVDVVLLVLIGGVFYQNCEIGFRVNQLERFNDLYAKDAFIRFDERMKALEKR